MWDAIAHFFSSFGIPTLLTAIIGYLLGSLSFSIIFTNLFIHHDIRSFGSGNAGATNVLRTVGKKAAALTFVCDFAKTAISISVGSFVFRSVAAAQVSADSIVIMGQYGAYIGGMFCFLGHLYPLYYKFKGGKGVTATAAIMLLIDWRVFLIELVVFFSLFALKRIVSLSSVASAVSYPLVTFLITYFIDYKQYLLHGGTAYTLNYVIITTGITAIIGAVVTIKHIENIKRLIHGTEKPISFKK